MLPPDLHTPRRIPNVAMRRSRPAGVVEALREEAAWQPVRAPQHAEEPGMLPSDELQHAEPIQQAPPATPSAMHGDQPGRQSDARATLDRGATPTSAQTRLGERLSALRRSADAEHSGSRWVAPQSNANIQVIEPAREKAEHANPQATMRLSPYGLNTPAVVGVHSIDVGVRTAAANDDSNGSPVSALAVRAVSDDWQESSSSANPLRRSLHVTRVAFESREEGQATDQTVDHATSLDSHDIDLSVPANPLR
jgi:hypothetical protein